MGVLLAARVLSLATRGIPSQDFGTVRLEPDLSALRGDVSGAAIPEIHDRRLRPEAVVLARLRYDEAAVPAVLADVQLDVRVAGDFRIAERFDRDERIVL